MAEPAKKNESNVEPIAPKKRAKSQETILKEKKRNIEKQLVILDKKVTDFEALEKEMEDVGTEREQLKAELDAVKAQLIKELGLE